MPTPTTPPSAARPAIRTTRLASLTTLASLASLAAFLAACHGAHPGARATPVAASDDGGCGQRSAVALSRARAPRTPRATRAARSATTGSGELVVRLAPADSGRHVPEGPVRVSQPIGGGRVEVRALAPAGRGWARSGPLPAGRYVVEAAGPGYRPSRLTVAVRPGATDTVRFRLAAACRR